MMTNTEIEAFVRERDEALMSMNRKKLLAYCAKYGVRVPSNKTVFWAGVHKARIASGGIPADEKRKSALWLRGHGFHTGF